MRVANPEQNEEFGLSFSTITRQAIKVLGLLGVRYVATEPALPLHTRQLKLAYHGPELLVYRNDAAAAPASVPAVVRTVANEAAALRLIESAFDPRREAIVEPGEGSPPAGEGTVSIEGETGSRVTMTANMTRAGLVVLNDTWAKGWSVEIDGRPAPVLRVNDVMRGLVVPQGRHRIVWTTASRASARGS